MAVFIFWDKQPDKPKLVVYARQPDGTDKMVDISRIEDALFTKLGTAGKEEYERYLITPMGWTDSPNGVDILTVRLQAWNQGQRYTVSGVVAVTNNGEIIWQ
jgi:hypothetical protein